ncbi:MAG: transketolase [Spartobacteria bacterium]|nr:transketolase [Spartobacteria bacterium]
MRTAFIQELILQARKNPKIFLVVGDLGFSVVEPFAKEFPDRFLNAGVAEQNMTGVAAGLASEGYHVFTYSIANFPTLRCLEQIRNDVCYHNLPVTVVSVGAGMAYGNLGYSHHAVQDLAIMRTLPNITVFSPADPGETRECVQWLSFNPRPSYLRIGKAGEPDLHNLRGIFDGPLRVCEGRPDAAIVATGSILKLALDFASEKAPEKRPTVFSMPLIKPLSLEFLEKLQGFKKIIALEEHVREGGLFAALCEVLSPTSHIKSISISEEMKNVVGSQDYLRNQAELKEMLDRF